MACQKLQAVPTVDIDKDGVFKYVLIKAFSTDCNGKQEDKILVRGYKRAEWHNDVYDETSDRVSGLGLETECLGGGRIQHDPEKKFIKVYGYSQGFGKADHKIAVELLKKEYSDYEITWSDEGY